MTKLSQMDALRAGVALLPGFKEAQAFYGTNTFTINRVELETIIAALEACQSMTDGVLCIKRKEVAPQGDEVEKVARAICIARGFDPNDTASGESQWTAYDQAARAAIAEIVRK